MFKSDFMEFCSHVHPITPVVLYTPLIVYMLYAALWRNSLSLATTAALFFIGVLIWTLLEYIIHRHIFHYEPKTAWGRKLHFIVHGVHHDYPNDATRLVMPPSVSVPLAIVFWVTFALLFGRFAPAISAGFAFRLRLLRFNPLRYASLSHEGTYRIVAETISPAPPL